MGTETTRHQLKLSSPRRRGSMGRPGSCPSHGSRIALPQIKQRAARLSGMTVLVGNDRPTGPLTFPHLALARPFARRHEGVTSPSLPRPPCPISSTPSTRSEERRVGKECVSTCRYRWLPYH